MIDFIFRFICLLYIILVSPEILLNSHARYDSNNVRTNIGPTILKTASMQERPKIS
jgi:hypothetical protein